MKLHFNKSLLSLSILAILSGTSTVYAAQAENIDNDIEVIEVTGIRGSLASAINSKRANEKIIDSINAEDIGKLPDVNLAESLQRITGIAITRENGEGAKVTIRGVQPNLNIVTVNGQTLATPTGTRAFSFNIISPGVVSGMDVVKSPTADLTEGGIGGTIDLKIKGALSQPEKAVVTGKATYDDMNDSWGNAYSGFFSKKFTDTAGVTGSISTSKRDVRRDWIGFDNFATPWLAKTIDGNEVFLPRMFTQGTRIDERERTSASLNFQFLATDDLDIRVTSLYSNETRDGETQRIRWQVANQAAGWDSSSFVFADDGKTVLSATSKKHNTAFVEPFGVIDDVEEETYAVAIDFDYSFDDSILSGSISTTEASRDALQLNSTFRHRNGPIVSYSIDPSSPAQPSTDFGNSFDDLSAFNLQSMNAYIDDYEDKETAFKLDYDHFVAWGWVNKVEAGVRVSNHEYSENRVQDRIHQGANKPTGTFADYQRSSFLVDNWLQNGSSEYANTTFVNVDMDKLFNGVPINYQDEIGKIWDTEEDVIALYLQASFEIGDYLTGVVGVRHVDTEQTTSDATSNIENDYDNTLFMFNMTYELSDDLLLRAAYADVMARPDYNDLQPNFNLNETEGTANGGNPWLQPYEASQYDLALEWYFNEGGLLAAGLFYKDIDTFIESNVVSQRELYDGNGEQITWVDPEGNTQTVWDYTSNDNGEGASIQGFELSYQQQFETGLGVQFNYTYAEPDTSYKDRDGHSIAMLDSSEDTVNAVVYYEQDDYSARLAYSYRSEFVSKIDAGGGMNLPQITDDAGYLDFSASYQAMAALQLTFNVINITEQERMLYIGSPLRQQAYRDDTSRRFVIGARYTF